MHNRGQNLTFIWELVRRNGDVITFPKDTKPRLTPKNVSPPSYRSTLNYTLSTDDVQDTIKCIARVDDENKETYEAKDEKRIPSYGTCDDRIIEYTNEMWLI